MSETTTSTPQTIRGLILALAIVAAFTVATVVIAVLGFRAAHDSKVLEHRRKVAVIQACAHDAQPAVCLVAGGAGR